MDRVQGHRPATPPTPRPRPIDRPIPQPKPLPKVNEHFVDRPLFQASTRIDKDIRDAGNPAVQVVGLPFRVGAAALDVADLVTRPIQGALGAIFGF